MLPSLGGVGGVSEGTLSAGGGGGVSGIFDLEPVFSFFRGVSICKFEEEAEETEDCRWSPSGGGGALGGGGRGRPRLEVMDCLKFVIVEPWEPSWIRTGGKNGVKDKGGFFVITA